MPSRFIGDLPKEASEHMETAAARAASAQGRWIDREGAAPTSWRRPTTPSAPPPRQHSPGERYVDFENADDMPEGVELRRGMTVVHQKFGPGEVLQIISSNDPAVVAFFPGWGEKKVLARFLKLG